MAATVEFGADAKQELLELRSENARLRLLTLLLRAAIKRLELVERAQTRARSNGKVQLRLDGDAARGRSHAADGRPAARSAARTAPGCETPPAARPSCRRSARFRLRRAGSSSGPIPPARGREVCFEAGPCRSSWIARACTSCGSLSFSVGAPVALDAAFFVDQQRQPRAGHAAGALDDEQVGGLDARRSRRSGTTARDRARASRATRGAHRASPPRRRGAGRRAPVHARPASRCTA